MRGGSPYAILRYICHKGALYVCQTDSTSFFTFIIKLPTSISSDLSHMLTLFTVKTIKTSFCVSRRASFVGLLNAPGLSVTCVEI